jgi:hypothetical protein
MVTAEKKLPPLPEIGRPDVYYARLINLAEEQNDPRLRAAAKVARYVTLALNSNLPWPEKFRYFSHALKHHCVPLSIEPDTQPYYEQLAELIRQHCGTEALRLASAEDDMYAARVALGQDRSTVEEDAETFFGMLLGNGDHCPPHFSETDWSAQAHPRSVDLKDERKAKRGK